jgi:hypothetical protein
MRCVAEATAVLLDGHVLKREGAGFFHLHLLGDSQAPPMDESRAEVLDGCHGDVRTIPESLVVFRRLALNFKLQASCITIQRFISKMSANTFTMALSGGTQV